LDTKATPTLPRKRVTLNGNAYIQRFGARATELKAGLLTNIVLAPDRQGSSAEGAFLVRFGPSFGRRERLGMKQDLAYDMTLEVQGLFRSIALRTRLDRELSVGETFTIQGRRWVVSRMDRGEAHDLDWRLVARELDERNPSPALA
jgi:hypothetical protein